MPNSSIFSFEDKFTIKSPFSQALETPPSKNVKISYIKTVYNGGDYFVNTGEYSIFLRVTAIGLNCKSAKITLFPFLNGLPFLFHFEESRTILLNNSNTNFEFKITRAKLDEINSTSTSSIQKYKVRIEVDCLEAFTATFEIKDDFISTTIKPPHGLRAVEKTFGNPANDDGTLNNAWQQANIFLVKPKNWKLAYQDNTKTVPTAGIRMHRLIVPNFTKAMSEIWDYAKSKVGINASEDMVLKWLEERNLNITAGGFNFRKITGGHSLSLHAFGIAIDWDPNHNPRKTPLTKTLPSWWYTIWLKWGFSNGCHFPTPDPMHIQFATGA